jgi:hypothetical protein
MLFSRRYSPSRSNGGTSSTSRLEFVLFFHTVLARLPVLTRSFEQKMTCSLLRNTVLSHLAASFRLCTIDGSVVAQDQHLAGDSFEALVAGIDPDDVESFVDGVFRAEVFPALEAHMHSFRTILGSSFSFIFFFFARYCLLKTYLRLLRYLLQVRRECLSASSGGLKRRAAGDASKGEMSTFSSG